MSNLTESQEKRIELLLVRLIKEIQTIEDKDEDFAVLIENNLISELKMNQCHKTHIITPKEFLRFGKQMGSHEIKNYNIKWNWDDKRILINPEINLWKDFSFTQPWNSINDILDYLEKNRPLTKKQQKKRLAFELLTQGKTLVETSLLTGYSIKTLQKLKK